MEGVIVETCRHINAIDLLAREERSAVYSGQLHAAQSTTSESNADAAAGWPRRWGFLPDSAGIPADSIDRSPRRFLSLSPAVRVPCRPTAPRPPLHARASNATDRETDRPVMSPHNVAID